MFKWYLDFVLPNYVFSQLRELFFLLELFCLEMERKIQVQLLRVVKWYSMLYKQVGESSAFISTDACLKLLRDQFYVWDHSFFYPVKQVLVWAKIHFYMKLKGKSFYIVFA